MNESSLSLGSNMGDRLKMLNQAVRLLEKHPRVDILKISSLYEASNPEIKSSFPCANCKNSLCLSGKKVTATASR